MNILMLTSPAPYRAGFSTSEKRAPLGLGMLMSVLEKSGHTVFFDDQYLKAWPIFDTPDYLISKKIELVGIYSNTICLQGTLSLLRKLHRLREQGLWHGKIAVGGPHTSYGAAELPEYVDHILIGEGEISFPKIVEGSNLPRISRGEKICDLDSLPFPAWRHFVTKPYVWTSSWGDEAPVFTLNTSRGCPHSCTFCSVKGVWGKSYRFMSSDRVLEEVDFLHKYYGMQMAYFREDHFTLHKGRLVDFCEKIISKYDKFSWISESRVDSIDDEDLIKLMARSGCRALYIGVESGSPRMLDYLKKGEKVEEFIRVFDLTRKYGIKTYASMVVGVPGETEQDLVETENFLERIKPDFIGRNVFVGIPGSELYDLLKANKQYDYEDENGILYPKGYESRAKKYYGDNKYFHVVSSALGTPSPEHPNQACNIFLRKNPKVSVILPVDTSEAFVKDCIDSILQQTYTDFELIVVDNASTDNTAEVLKTVRDPRVIKKYNKSKTPVPQLLNKEFTRARGDYIALMDTNHIAKCDRLGMQVSTLESNLEIGACGSQVETIYGEHLNSYYPEKNEWIKSQALFKNPFSLSSVVIRASKLDAFTFHESLKHGYAHELWLRLSLDPSIKLMNLPYILSSVRPPDRTSDYNSYASESKDEVVRQYLECLCGSVGEQDFKIHKKLMDGVTVALANDEIVMVKNWLTKLKKHNLAAGLYPLPFFDVYLAQLLWEVCVNSISRGPFALKQALSYPDIKYLDLEQEYIESLVAKSLWSAQMEGSDDNLQA